MKTIEELGISPTPWSVESYETVNNHYVVDNSDHAIFLFSRSVNGKANACITAAAPKMYECLTEAVEMQCHECQGGDCYNCQFRRWKDALAEASGEVSNG